jgi:hypothetical protein
LDQAPSSQAAKLIGRFAVFFLIGLLDLPTEFADGVVACFISIPVPLRCGHVACVSDRDSRHFAAYGVGSVAHSPDPMPIGD